MNKTQVQKLEKLLKDALYDALELSKFACYNAVLVECGLLSMEYTVKIKKISFVNAVIHSQRENVECRDVLLHENNLYPDSGLLHEVRQYCEELGVPDVTVTRVDKDDLTKKAKNTAFMKQWLRLAASSKVRMRWRPEKLQDRQYFSRDKLTAKLLLCYRIGELNFKTNRKGEATAKTGSTLCLGRVCGGEDSLAHVMECETYDTRYSGVDSEWALADYLVKLYIERNKKYGNALVYMRR